MKTPNSKPLWIPEGGKNLQRWRKTLQASITLSGSHGGYTLHQICNPDSFDKGVTHWTGTRVWKQSPVTCVKATTWRQEYLSIDRNIDHPYTEKIWSWNKYRLSRVIIILLPVGSSGSAVLIYTYLYQGCLRHSWHWHQLN